MTDATSIRQSADPMCVTKEGHAFDMLAKLKTIFSRRITLWVFGYTTRFYSLYELLRIARDPITLAICGSIGFILGLDKTGSFSDNYQAQATAALLMAAVYLAIPLALVFLMALYISFRRLFNPSYSDATPAFLPIFPCSLIVLAPIILYRMDVRGVFELSPLMITSVFVFFLLLYAVITEFFIYVILKFIEPISQGILEQQNLERAQRKQERAQPPQTTSSQSSWFRAPFKSMYDKEIKLWILGFRTCHFTFHELILVARAPITLTLCAMIGFIIGRDMAETATLQPSVQIGVSLTIAAGVTLIPIVLIILAFAYLKIRETLQRGTPKREFETLLTFPFSILAVTPLAVYRMELRMVTEKSTESTAMYFFSFVFLYLIVAEFFIYVVVQFIAPAIIDKTKPDSPSPVADITERKAPQNFAELPPSNILRFGKSVVRADQVSQLEAQGNYLRIVTKEREHLERFRISHAIDMMDEGLGFSPHRSYWISYSGIEGYKFIAGKLLIVMEDGSEVRVAIQRQSEIKRKLSDLGFSIVTD